MDAVFMSMPNKINIGLSAFNLTERVTYTAMQNSTSHIAWPLPPKRQATTFTCSVMFSIESHHSNNNNNTKNRVKQTCVLLDECGNILRCRLAIYISELMNLMVEQVQTHTAGRCAGISKGWTEYLYIHIYDGQCAVTSKCSRLLARDDSQMQTKR